jgi:hypothetical protein
MTKEESSPETKSAEKPELSTLERLYAISGRAESEQRNPFRPHDRKKHTELAMRSPLKRMIAALLLFLLFSSLLYFLLQNAFR